jgi:uncharacterized protein YwgA
MEIHPKDAAIMQNLAALEEAGENGFKAYYSGDKETGSQEIKKVLHDSAKNINSLHDAQLRKEAKKLLNLTNKAIQEYMKNPSDSTLSALKSDIDAYKGFIDDHQS